jgi:outer membrane protein, heavy metal efflux system
MRSLSFMPLRQQTRMRRAYLKSPMFGLLVAVLVAGCALPLPYVSKPPAQEESRTAFAARRLESEALKQFLASAGKTLPSGDQGWDFETLSLASTFYSPDLSVAEARWREAIVSSGMILRPKALQIEFLADHHSVTEPVRPSPWAWGIGFEFVLPDADRKAAKIQLATDQVALARLELASMSWKSRSVLRTIWIDYFAAQERERLALQQVEILRNVLVKVERRVEGGVQGRGDGLQAQASLKMAERERDEALRTLTSQAAHLRASLHLPPERGLLPSLVASNWEEMSRSIEPLSPVQLQDLALNNRLDLKEAEARYAITDAKLRLEVAQQYPELSFKPGYEWDQGDHRIKLGMNIPIALPAAHKAAIDTVMAERDTQGQVLLATQERVLQELAQAHLEWRAAQDRLKDIQRNQKSVEESFEKIKLSIRLGETDPLQEYEAELKVLAAKIQTLEAEITYQKSLAGLEDVLQLPLPSISMRGTR